MRLFVAIFPPPLVISELWGRISSAPMFPSLRWMSSEVCHITIKFLGSVPAPKLVLLKDQLSHVSEITGAFQLCLKGGGAFPRIKTPQSCWVGVQGEVFNLKTLAEDVDRILAEEGFLFEGRSFVPHLTIARSKSKGKPTKDGIGFCKLFETFQSSMFQVNAIQLVESHLGPAGSSYQILQSFPLGSRL